MRSRFLDAREAGQISIGHGGNQRLGHVASRIQQQRNEVVGWRADDRVLKIEQAAPADARTICQPHQIIDMIVAQGESRWQASGQRQELAPQRKICLMRSAARSRVLRRRQIPIDEQRSLLEERAFIVGAEIDAGRNRMAVQGNQQINRGFVKRDLIAAGIEA